jgi:hypothetical protein
MTAQPAIERTGFRQSETLLQNARSINLSLKHSANTRPQSFKHQQSRLDLKSRIALPARPHFRLKSRLNPFATQREGCYRSRYGILKRGCLFKA